MTPAERNAGLEKMARAMCETLNVHPNYWNATTRLAGNPALAATAALAAWEAHIKEIEHDHRS